MKVLFVCAGNTCRSPMLEYMFKDYLKTLGVSDIAVDSAGIINHEKSISPYLATVLSAHGIVYDDLRPAKYCTQSVINGADYVIAVTAEIADILRENYGFEKIVSLRDIAGYDIDDPHGKGLEEYQKAYKLLFETLPEIYGFIKAKN